MNEVRSKIKELSRKESGGIRLSSLILVAYVVLTLSIPYSVNAVTITVNTTDDELNADGDCSLREAIRSANMDAVVGACIVGSDTDTIELPAGTYTIIIPGTGEDAAATGDLDITDGLTIIGDGATNTIIDGGSLDRVFHIVGSIAVKISGVMIRNGGDTEGGTGGGGGISNEGTLTLNNSVISSNSTTSGSGGGISNIGTITLTNSTVSDNSVDGGGGGISNVGILTLNYSTLSSNSALQGGGIENIGTLILSNSTINDNEAFSENGGGIASTDMTTITNSTISGNSAALDGGGIWNLAALNLSNVTITNNTADSSNLGDGNGGGIFNFNDTGTVSFKNTIIAENIDTGGEAPDCSGTLNSHGFNLIQDTTGCTIGGDITGNITGLDPNFGPLANNGGPTPTHALLSGSPAIDTGDNAACPAIDQRGFLRPIDGDNNSTAICDIGAFEFGSTPLTCGGFTVTMAGTLEDDVIIGTDDLDVIDGLGGDDAINGLAGNDIICGGDGNDILNGGIGRDRLFGQGGVDILNGNSEKDLLYGGVGGDTLRGHRGNDYLNGGAGNDTCDGGAHINGDAATGCETVTNVP